MNTILKIVKKYQLKQNLTEIISFLLSAGSILLLLIQIYSFIILIYPQNIIENYWIAQFFKFFWIAASIWMAMKFEKRLISKFQAAKFIDLTTQDTEDSVTNAYEMLTNKPDGNTELIKLYLSSTEQKITNKKPVLNLNLFKKISKTFSIILALSFLQILIAGNSAFQAQVSFFKTKTPSVHFSQKIIVIPGNTTVSRGSILGINVVNPLDKANYKIYYKFEELWRSEDISEGKKYFNNIDNSFTYFIKNQWSTSDTFFVSVLEDPTVKQISLRYKYPPYLNKKNDYIEHSDGNIVIPQFSSVEITIKTPETIRDANIVFSDRSFLKMENLGREYKRIEFSPEVNTGYHFLLEDILGNRNNIVNRTISVIEDKAPLISFVYPGKDTVMTQNNLFEVRISASDDYGLKNLKLFYQINNLPQKDTLLVKQSSLNFINISHILDFRQNPLFPGDEVTYWAEVYDNSPLNQKATTPRFKLRFPSIEDIFRELEKQEQQQENMLNRIFDDIQELKKDFDLKKREMLRKDEISWDDKNAIEKMIQEQQTLNEMIENVAQNYDNMIQQLEVNEAVSKEILDKMQKIQEIMEQISNDDIKKAMEKMQQSLEKLNPEELRQAMQDFEFKLEDFAEKLEQTLKLLQDIKNEQNIEKSLEIAKEMQMMQEELLKKTEDASNTQHLSEEQKTISDKLEALKEQMKKTMDEMNKSQNSKEINDLQNIMQEIESSELSQDMQDSADALSKNQKQESMQKQQQSLSKMAKMLSKMQDMQDSMSGAGMEKMFEAVQSTIYRLLMLSKEHEIKVSKINNDPIPFMPQFIADFESLQLSIQKLYEAPQILLFLGQKFFNDLNFTVNSYRELFYDVQNSRLHTHKKLTSDIQAGINLLIYDLMQTLNQMQQGGQGGQGGMQSLMQALEQMSTQQMAMNTITQSIMEQMASSGNRVSNQMRQQLQEIAAEEQRLADNLKRMMQTNPEAQKHAGALNEISNELEDIARKIRQNRIDKNLIDQQNRIMSRLIEVQRSINKRDKSNQRQGETADKQLWDIPADLNLNFKNEAERRALEEEIQKLPFEYRQIILEYLRRLNN